MVHGRLARTRGLFEYEYKVQNGHLLVLVASFQLSRATLRLEMGPGMLRSVALWLDQRLHVTRLFASTAGHAVPASAHSWFYVFGSGTLLCFIIQVVTASVWRSSMLQTANDAWTSLLFLNYQQPLGWLLRAMHYWGSNFMVAVMTLHMVQVFYFGAYKYPREADLDLRVYPHYSARWGWLFNRTESAFRRGCLLGAWHWRSIMGRTPFIGARLVQLMLAGPIIAARPCRVFSRCTCLSFPASSLPW